MEVVVLFSTGVAVSLFLVAKYTSDARARWLRGTAYLFIFLVPALVLWRMFGSFLKMRQVLAPPKTEGGGASAFLWPVVFVGFAAAVLFWLRRRQNILAANANRALSPALSAEPPIYPVGICFIAFALFGMALVLVGIVYLLYALQGMSGSQLQALMSHPVWRYALAFVLLRMDNVLYFAVPATILLVTSAGLLLLKPWARVAAVLVAGLITSTMLTMLSAAMFMRRTAGTKPFIAVFFGWAIWYLNRANVREAFERGTTTPPVSPPAGPKADRATLGN